MGIVKPSKEIVFVNEKTREAWRKTLRDNPDLARQLLRAKKDILENAFCGIQFPKRLIPKELALKYNLSNLWKYNLPDAWRLLYTITTPNKVEIIAVVLDWVNHKDYERLFRF